MKISDDPEIARKQLARELANNSIVNKALARYIERILEAVFEDTIQPLRDESDRLRRELEEARRALEPVGEQWRAIEDGSPKTSWYPVGYGDKAGWDAIARRHPEKYQVVTRPVFAHPDGAEIDICKRTFVVQHNPNCPSPWLVRLPGKSGSIDMKPYSDGIGIVRHQTGDILGFGKTLEDAARAALARAEATP